MKWNSLTFSVLFLVLLPYAFCSETLVSTEDIRDQGTILDIFQNPFTLQMSGINNGDKIALKGEKEVNGVMKNFFMWLNRGECGITVYTKFCYSSSTNSTGTWIATIQKYNLSPSVSLSASSSASSLLIGEPFEITLSLSNSGSFRATNISLTLALGDEHEFNVEYKDTFVQNATHLSYVSDSLLEDQTMTFVPELRVQKEGPSRIYYTLSYQDFYGLIPVTTTSFIEVNVSDYLNYSFTLSSPSLYVDAVSNFTVFIQNNITDATVAITSLKIEYPSFLISQNLFRLTNPQSGILTYKTSNLTYNVSRIPHAEFVAKAPGKGEIIVTMEYQTSKSSTAQSVVTSKIPVSVIGKEAKLVSSLPDSGYYTGGQELPVVLSMSNPYETAYLVVKQISVNLDGVTQQYPASFSVPPHTTQVIVNTTLRIPSVTLDKVSSLYMNVSYGGEGFPDGSLAKNHTLSISKDSLEISLNIEPNILHSGENALVSVSIKNPTSRTFSGLHIYDVTELITSTNASVVVDILPNQSLDVYSYEVIAPFVAEETNLSHATLVELSEGDRNRVYLNETIVAVFPLEEDGSPNSTAADVFSHLGEKNITTVLLQGDATQQEGSTFYTSSLFWLILIFGISGVCLSGFFTWKHFRNVDDSDEDVSVIHPPTLPDSPLNAFHTPLDEVRIAMATAQKLPNEPESEESKIDSMLASMEKALEKTQDTKR